MISQITVGNHIFATQITEEMCRNLSFISGQVQGGTRGYLKKMGFLHQNLLKELRRSRKAKLTPEEAGEGADPVVPESVEEEIDESALVDGMPGRGGEGNRLVELQNLGFGQRSFTYSSPFNGRKTGLSAHMQASQDNRKTQEQYNLKGKSVSNVENDSKMALC